MILNKQKCVSCRKFSPHIPDEEILVLLPQITNWAITEISGIKRLSRNIDFTNFADAIDFGMKIGQLAESEGHHPKLTIEWGKVSVDWWTHKIGGLHKNDFIMAAKTDQVYESINDSRLT
jgi:4a-hydroxytetrahydrobiopterin dehydratase